MKLTAAEWAANRERRALPHYGGNRIPASHLARFTLRGSPPEEESDLPDNIASFVKDQL